MSARVWAVVPNWNGGEDNRSCLASLLEQGLTAERIVFVDNASEDGSLELVEREFPVVRILRNETNTGYGHACNQGVDIALESGAEYVLFVNNDLVMPAGTLERLLEPMAADPALGIVGPRVLYRAEPERVWCAGGLMTFRQNLSTMLGHQKPDGPRYQRTLDVDYVPGCAMLVRRAVFERAGRLEGDYFAYHEDVEFCLKAKRAGFAVRVIGAEAAYHGAHQSTGGGYNPRRKYMMGLNTVRFLRRHGTIGRWLSFLVFDVLSLPAVWGYRALRGEGAAVRAKARGMWDGLRGRRVTAESVQEGRADA